MKKLALVIGVLAIFATNANQCNHKRCVMREKGNFEPNSRVKIGNAEHFCENDLRSGTIFAHTPISATHL